MPHVDLLTAGKNHEVDRGPGLLISFFRRGSGIQTEAAEIDSRAFEGGREGERSAESTLGRRRWLHYVFMKRRKVFLQTTHSISPRYCLLRTVFEPDIASFLVAFLQNCLCHEKPSLH